MPCCENDGTCRDIRYASVLFISNGCNFAVTRSNVGNTRAKVNFATEGNYPFTDGTNNIAKPVGSEVRGGGIQNVFPCATIDKRGKNLHFIFIHRSAFELSVRVCARPSLSELDVAFGVKDAKAVKQIDLFSPFIHGKSAFEDDRPCTGFGKSQGGKKSTRSKSDDNRSEIGGKGRSGKVIFGTFGESVFYF